MQAAAVDPRRAGGSGGEDSTEALGKGMLASIHAAILPSRAWRAHRTGPNVENEATQGGLRAMWTK
ncbi:hypothetical protein GCM10009692_22790 [Leucobacter aridicollis]